ncbi:MAG: hypothetical protein KAT00_03520 [Planctomycetes bacterium]|nr:hypothetical protein [Planctomycetota bacterium]
MRIRISILTIAILLSIGWGFNYLTPSLVFKATIQNETENAITCYVVNGSNNECNSYDISAGSKVFARLRTADGYREVENTVFLFIAVDADNHVIMARDLTFEENKVHYVVEIRDDNEAKSSQQ